MAWLELIAAAESSPVELAVVYGVSAGAAVYLAHTIFRIFKPKRRAKSAGCANCDKCG